MGVNQSRIYLDHAATTPVDPNVREAMFPFLGENYGNPSSIHRCGQAARRAIDAARDALAAALACDASEVTFTSGGTEADNLAVLGVLLACRDRGRDHVVVASAEHHAVLDAALAAERLFGFRTSVVSVDIEGKVDPEAVAEVVDDRTALVSIMHANNEIGSFNPVRAIAEVAHARGAWFHTDAVQSFGAVPVSFASTGADLISVSAHKIYGPKGVGALAVRSGTPMQALQQGGGQERGRRPGTENIAGVVGFGAAAERLAVWRDSERVRQAALRDAFVSDLAERIPGTQLNGAPVDRLPGNANLAFPAGDAETLLLALDMLGIAASAGSACAAGSLEPSHVLLATGMGMARARRSLRFSLGRTTTREDLDQVVSALVGRFAGNPGASRAPLA